MKKYANFEIWIDPATDPELPKFRVQVVSSPAGVARGEMELDLRDKEFKKNLVRVRGIEPNLGLRTTFGETLFNALFSTKEVKEVWDGSLGRVDANGEVDGLRLRLSIDVPQLAALPWELLYAPTREFLAISANQAFSRSLPVLEPANYNIEGPLRILLVVESPPDLTPVEDKEVELLKKAISDLGDTVECDVLRNETISNIRDALMQTDYHVLHFLGHGSAGKLALIDDENQRQDFDDNEFAQLFHGRDHIRLVVLNACHSGQADEKELFTGIGPALIKKRIPAVIAMQYHAVAVETASRFSRTFYRALAKGTSVDIAVNEARGDLSTGKLLNNRDWSTPVLYMGTREGQILDFHPNPDDPDPDPNLENVVPISELSDQVKEIEFLTNRLREWFELDNDFRDLRIFFDNFDKELKKIVPPNETPSNENITNLEFPLDMLKARSDQILRNPETRFEYIISPLGNDKERLNDQWFSDLADIAELIQDKITNPKLKTELKRNVLINSSKEFQDNLREKHTTTRNKMSQELEKLDKLVANLNLKLKV
ncbi:MAG: CHAT domain-containing protein [bacterium]|nr:CHAT domain-containing protein [bacterium]